MGVFPGIQLRRNHKVLEKCFQLSNRLQFLKFQHSSRSQYKDYRHIYNINNDYIINYYKNLHTFNKQKAWHHENRANVVKLTTLFITNRYSYGSVHGFIFLLIQNTYSKCQITFR